jgi:hypothetical protein
VAVEESLTKRLLRAWGSLTNWLLWAWVRV